VADSYQPGDIIVDSLTITSLDGKKTLDLTSSFLKASVYESIVVPSTIAEVTVLDMDDQIGVFKIVGGENVDFKFKAPGSENASFKLAVVKPADVMLSGAASKSKTYKILMVSPEVLYAAGNHVQKGYKEKQISDIVQDIVKNYLKSDKSVDAESTQGQQTIVLPHYDAFKAIDWLRKRAVSSQNKSSLFVFYETRDNGTQKYKLSTIENLFKGSVIKDLKQSDTVGHSIYESTHDNIIAYKIPHVANALERIRLGGKQKTTTLDTGNMMKTSNVSNSSASFTTGGTGEYNTQSFADKYLNSENPRQDFIPVDRAQRPETHMAGASVDQRTYLSILLQNTMLIRVPGDSALKAGGLINCNIPIRDSTTSDRKNDPMLSGKFLITRIHHEITDPGQRPRYTCNIECIKGKLQESAQ
jgi:hypothetical protein